jgi:hypothetical protein
MYRRNLMITQNSKYINPIMTDIGKMIRNMAKGNKLTDFLGKLMMETGQKIRNMEKEF